VADSRGREYYFSCKRRIPRLTAFVTKAATSDRRSDGEIRVGNEKWTNASDLSFNLIMPAATTDAGGQTADEIPVLLTGGHRVGQTFKAERNNLAGIWLPIDRLNNEGETTRFVFGLSVPCLPIRSRKRIYVGPASLRFRYSFGLVAAATAGECSGWVYLVCMIGFAIALQAIFKTSNLAEQSLRFFASSPGIPLFSLVRNYVQ